MKLSTAHLTPFTILHTFSMADAEMHLPTENLSMNIRYS